MKPETVACLDAMKGTLAAHIRIMDALIAVTIGHEAGRGVGPTSTPLSEAVAAALPLLLQATESSANTLVTLSASAGLHTRDCYSISRSIVELAVNVCYILSEGEPAADRMLRHARQKAFVDLRRESKIESSVITLSLLGAPATSDIPGLEAEIAEFTSRDGREKGWIDESIDKRIGALGQRLGHHLLTALHAARFMVYRHSSEILHGTLFSAYYFFGMGPGGLRDRGEAEDYIGGQHIMILLASVIALAAIVEAFDEAHGVPNLRSRSKELFDRIRDLEWFKRGEGPSGGS